jgi:hypothetical protein
VHASADDMIAKCRARWRELTLAIALFTATTLAVITGLFFGRPGWHVDNQSFEKLVESAEEAFIAEGPGTLATTAAAESNDVFFLVEDAVTGQAIKRNRRARGTEFKRWTRYKVLDSYEMSGRLVAGLKESKSIVIRIQPKGLQLPNVEQLREIAETLRSAEHHSTYVYFFLPGMDLKLSPWSTVFQQSSRPTSVSFDKTNVPELYRRFEETVWK